MSEGTREGSENTMGGDAVMQREHEMEFLSAGEVVDGPRRVLSEGTKIWRTEGGLRHRENDLPADVGGNGLMTWPAIRAERLPTQVSADGVVALFGYITPVEVEETEYAGVPYSVPYWMVEAYPTGRMEDEESLWKRPITPPLSTDDIAELDTL